MIKLTFCLHRLPHLSREAFQEYWLNEHGPLVRAQQQILAIKRYDQVHTLTTPLDDLLRAGRGAPESFDGVAELYWDSVDSMAAASASPQGQEAGRILLEDEQTFIDLARSPIFLTEVKSVIAPVE